MCLLQMRENRIFWGHCGRGDYVTRPGGSNAEVCFLLQWQTRANLDGMKQNLCRHKQESDNHLMLRCNNDIPVYSWHISNCLCSNERMWVCDQVPSTILTHFNVSALLIPQIPLPIYTMCIFVGPWFVDIAHPVISLVYGTDNFLSFIPETPVLIVPPSDLLAFLVIVYLVVRSNVNKVPIPGLLKTIARDATYYFLIIFTSHLVLVMFLLFANVRISS